LAQPVAIQTLLAVNGDVVDPDVAGESGSLGQIVFPGTGS
jgi:hypothetical protein